MVRKMMLRLFVASGAALAVVASASASALAEGDHSMVQLWNNSGTARVAGSHSTLERDDDGVKMAVHAVALPPGAPVRVRWVIFNRPAACTGGNPLVSMCGPADLGNPAVGASMIDGPVERVTARGVANLKGSLDAGATGLTNPGGAEIQLLVRVEVATATGLKFKTFQFAVHDPEDRQESE